MKIFVKCKVCGSKKVKFARCFNDKEHRRIFLKQMEEMFKENENISIFSTNGTSYQNGEEKHFI